MHWVFLLQTVVLYATYVIQALAIALIVVSAMRRDVPSIGLAVIACVVAGVMRASANEAEF